MKFSQLIRHLETKHPNHATKTLEFFRRRETSLECQILILPDVSTERTSLIWSCTWNCQAKNLTRLENTLVNPVCWKEYNYFLKKVVRQTWDKYLFPAVLFRGAFQICRKDVKDQVINEMKASPTPMLFFKWMSQQMLIRVLSCLFSWDIFIQETLKEEFLFCEELQTTTNADVREM